MNTPEMQTDVLVASPASAWTSGRKASTAFSDVRAAMSAPATTPMLDETMFAHILNSEVPNAI